PGIHARHRRARAAGAQTHRRGAGADPRGGRQPPDRPLVGRDRRPVPPGRLDPYRPDYLGDLHGWAVRQYAMSQNHVGGFYTSAIGFGWNEEVLKKKNLPAPKCWKDLLDPRYKGEIETSHPGSSGTGYTIIAGTGA